LDQVAVMGELQAAVVDRAVARDEKLDGLALQIGMEPEVVGLEMVHQNLERRHRPVGRSFFGHTQHFRQTAPNWKPFACHITVETMAFRTPEELLFWVLKNTPRTVFLIFS
jgi:hypothetical protein